VTTSFVPAVTPGTVNRDLFQLVSPADYTPDFVDGGLRRESCTIQRTLGAFSMIPFLAFSDPQEAANNEAAWKAALFIGSAQRVDDAFNLDPTIFDIAFNPLAFAVFCRDWSVMQVFWFCKIGYSVAPDANNVGTQFSWTPADGPMQTAWDVTVKRKLETDEALFLLINSQFNQAPTTEFAGSIEVESRVLLHD